MELMDVCLGQRVNPRGVQTRTVTLIVVSRKMVAMIAMKTTGAHRTCSVSLMIGDLMEHAKPVKLDNYVMVIISVPKARRTALTMMDRQVFPHVMMAKLVHGVTTMKIALMAHVKAIFAKLRVHLEDCVKQMPIVHQQMRPTVRTIAVAKGVLVIDVKMPVIVQKEDAVQRSMIGLHAVKEIPDIASKMWYHSSI